MQITTPVGRLTVLQRDDEEYLGINVYLDGTLISVIEYTPIKNLIHICSYNSENEPPIINEVEK